MLEAVRIIMAPEHLFMGLGVSLPIQILYLWLLERVVPAKSKGLFWAVSLTLSALAALLRPIMPDELRGMVGIFLSVVVPFLLLGGPRGRRLIACSLSMVFMAVGELVGGSAWMLLTGIEVMDPVLTLAHAPAFLWAALVGYGLVMAPCMVALSLLWRRFFSEKGAEKVSSRSAEHPWVRYIASFPLLQMPFVFIVLTVSLNFMRGEATYVATAMALLLLCVVVDGFLIVQVKRSIEGRRAEMEAALLEAQVGSYLGELAAMQRLLDDTARLRHDVRNHQSVVRALCDGGDYAEAHRYLEGARDLVGR